MKAILHHVSGPVRNSSTEYAHAMHFTNCNCQCIQVKDVPELRLVQLMQQNGLVMQAARWFSYAGSQVV